MANEMHTYHIAHYHLRLHLAALDCGDDDAAQYHYDWYMFYRLGV